LKQMLVNLLSNAIKFTPEGGNLGLEVRCNFREKNVFFTVWDEGIGIRPEDIGKLFQPFVQLDSSLARQYAGTGLGLALVERTAELHGGSIKVESVPGAGSRFTIALPWSALVTRPLPNLMNHSLDSIKTILTIEDIGLDASRITHYLIDLGIMNVIQPVLTGALEKAADLQPSIILLDLSLPDGDGMDLLAQLKADERTRNIQIIIISGEERRSEALKLGASAYLLKPYLKEDLLAVLKKVAVFLPTPAPESKTETVSSAPLVLIADDDDLILRTVTDFLIALGLQAFPVHSGFELLERAPEIKPDLMLVDIQMPGMDGLETMRRLRAHNDQRLAATPIIAVTALAMPGDQERCIQAGANEYLSKPVSLRKLVEQINRLLEEKGGQP
ncbi:MAG: response regulator, partial [Chloroflexi bacterium]|nr:response regulator [Chloroflexota bacterium]